MSEPNANDNNIKTNETYTLEQVSLDNIFLDSDFQALFRESISSSGQADTGYDYNAPASWFWEQGLSYNNSNQQESNPLVIQPLTEGVSEQRNQEYLAARHPLRLDIPPVTEITYFTCSHGANESHTSRCIVITQSVRITSSDMVTTSQQPIVSEICSTGKQINTEKWTKTTSDNENGKDIDDKIFLDISRSKSDLSTVATQMGYTITSGYNQQSNVTIAATTNFGVYCSSLEKLRCNKLYSPSTYSTCKTSQTQTTQSSHYMRAVSNRPIHYAQKTHGDLHLSGSSNAYFCREDQHCSTQHDQHSQSLVMPGKIPAQDYQSVQTYSPYLSMLPPQHVRCLPTAQCTEETISNVGMNVYSRQDITDNTLIGNNNDNVNKCLVNIMPDCKENVSSMAHVKVNVRTDKSDLLQERSSFYNPTAITGNESSFTENIPFMPPGVKVTNQELLSEAYSTNFMGIPFEPSEQTEKYYTLQQSGGNPQGFGEMPEVKQEMEYYGGLGYFMDSSGTTPSMYPGLHNKNLAGDYSSSTQGPWGMCSALMSSSDAEIAGSMADPQNPATSKGEKDFHDLDSSMDIMDYEESGTEGQRGKRLNHSEIEKRRRDKMNAYIVELAELIPMCGDVNRKLDKLTVLRMAVQHIKALKGTGNSPTEVSHLPSCIAEEEVKKLVLKASQGFLFSVSCDRGKILHVSDTIANILNYTQSDLTGKYLFDFLHHKDVHKVKDQLATNEFVSKERYIDAKTMKLVRTKLPQTNSDLRSGGRRLFVCRMKKNKHCDMEEDVKESITDPLKSATKRTQDSDYVTVVCSGYIKVWALKPGSAPQEEEDSNSGDQRSSMNLNKLVAVALPVSPIEYQEQRINESEQRGSALEFMSRLNIEGKFVYVDHRVTSVLGYVPQELINTSIYEYCHPEYINSFSQIHKQVLISQEKVENRVHKFRTKNRSSVLLSTSAFVFRNPWTKEREHIVCNHRLIFRDNSSSCAVTSSSEEEVDKSMYQESGRSRLTGRSVLPMAPHDIGRIGKQIALQIHGHSSHSPHQAADSTIQSSSSRDRAQSPSGHTSSSCIDSSSGTETTDEASMAIIMNLLEADAGLGGPVDFSDLPWPL